MAQPFIPGVRFVAQDPKDNRFYIFYNGQPHYFNSQAEAEQNYNSLFPDSAVSPAAQTGDYGSQIDAWNAYNRATTQSNRERLTEMQRQFDVGTAAAAKQTQQSLATSLLEGATQLARLPESWPSYTTYTQGGRNIFQSLYGSQPVPAFGAPTGYSTPLTMSKLLEQMGLSGAPGMQEALAMSTAPVTGAPATQQQQSLVPLPHQINPAVWDSFSDTAKRMTLGAAEAGYTPSGVWTANDFLAQLNAARPQGIAPKQVTYNWQQPQSYF